MTFSFNPAYGLVVVEVELVGPTRSELMHLALDTGAHRTMIDPDSLVSAGYDLSTITSHSSATTAGGVITVARLPILQLTSLGSSVHNFEVVAHKLPSSASVDGLLGLDFFRGHILNIDFQKGEITLSPGATP